MKAIVLKIPELTSILAFLGPIGCLNPQVAYEALLLVVKPVIY